MAPYRVPTSRGLKVPRLKLRPERAEESLTLDGADLTERGAPTFMPPFVPYSDFSRAFWGELKQGEHITAVGANGSGKTTLMLDLCLPRRRYTIVLATKVKDVSLYPRLQREGYVLTQDPKIDWNKTPKVIFKPSLRSPSREAVGEQSEAFEELLLEAFDTGGWCLYGDEIRYLAQNLKLEPELDTLWLQGRSLGISMYVSTQRPVSIPVVAFEAATHLFIFRTTDKRNIQRIGEFEGANEDVLRYILPRLPRYEVLYINTRTGVMQRTKVIPRGNGSRT